MPPEGFTSFAVKRQDGSIMCVDAIDVNDLFANRIGEQERARTISVEPYDPKTHLKSWEYDEFLNVQKAIIAGLLPSGIRAGSSVPAVISPSALEEAVRSVLLGMSETAKPIIIDPPKRPMTSLEIAMLAAQSRKA